MSQKKLKTSIVIPAKNEGHTIADVVQRILAVDSDFEVIVIDDGSEDDTTEKARRAGARVVRHEYNLGNGSSVKSGILKATGDVVVMIDADGQHPPEEIPTLLEGIGRYDMVVGSRTRKSSTSKFRNVGNFVLNRLACWIAKHPIMDLTSGFRAIKREVVLEYLHLFPARYSYPTTITMAMILGQHFVKYEPLDSIQSRHHGQSNIKPFRDFFRFVNIMMRVLILFSPQRFFMPLAILSTISGICFGVYQLMQFGGVFGTSTLLMISGAIFFCFGLVSEQLAVLRRQKNEKPPTREILEPIEEKPE